MTGWEAGEARGRQGGSCREATVVVGEAGPSRKTGIYTSEGFEEEKLDKVFVGLCGESLFREVAWREVGGKGGGGVVEAVGPRRFIFCAWSYVFLVT